MDPWSDPGYVHYRRGVLLVAIAIYLATVGCLCQRIRRQPQAGTFFCEGTIERSDAHGIPFSGETRRFLRPANVLCP